MTALVEVSAHSFGGPIGPADVQLLVGALGSVAARLGLEVPELDTSEGSSLGYAVDVDALEPATVFRGICGELGLVFAMSRVRPEWSWAVRATPSMLSDVAGVPDVLWIRNGEVVLRHADAPQGQQVVASPELTEAVSAELAHGLGAEALRWLGIPSSDRPSEQARREALTSGTPTDIQGSVVRLDGPVAGTADTSPLAVVGLDVNVGEQEVDGLTRWSARVRVRVSSDAPPDSVEAHVRLRRADGTLLDVAVGRVAALSAGDVLTISADGAVRGVLSDAVAADVWFALGRTARAVGVSLVRCQES